MVEETNDARHTKCVQIFFPTLLHLLIGFNFQMNLIASESTTVHASIYNFVLMLVHILLRCGV